MLKKRSFYARDIEQYKKQKDLENGYQNKNDSFDIPPSSINLSLDDNQTYNQIDSKFSPSSDSASDLFDTEKNIRKELKETEIQMKKKFSNYKEQDKKHYRYIIEQRSKPENNEFLETKYGSITSYVLLKLQKQYNMPQNQRDYEAIYDICKKFQFLSKFSKRVVIYLLQYSQIVQYPPNQYIFKQGETGKDMYIIIRGQVNLRIVENGYEQIVGCLYDGQQFGELGVFFNNKKTKSNYNMNDVYNRKKNEDVIINGQARPTIRTATIETTEMTTLFKINFQHYMNMLIQLIESDLKQILNILSNMPFLKDIEHLALIPIANIIQIKKFSYGEIILNQDQSPENFYIVSKGKVKAIKLMVIERKKEQQKDRRDQRFNFSQTKSVQKKGNFFQIKQNKQQLAKSLNPRFIYSNYQKIEETVRSIKFFQQHLFKEMQQGQFFFQRSIIKDSQRLEEDKQKYNYKSKLTVISDSCSTELYIINQNQMRLIPEALKERFIEGLKEYPPYDIKYDKETDVKTQQWEQNKMKMLKKIQKYNTNY